ncbi:MAG: formimidoylglutamase [Gemmatimonadales bacterium]
MIPADPTGVVLPDPAPGDRRLGHLLGARLDRTDAPDVVLLGFPSDEGVRRNGGRVGAAGGPAAIRAALYAMTPDPRSGRLEELLGRARDLGDLEISGDVESDQRRLGDALAPHLGREAFVIVLGGGHEASYGHFLGYASAGRRVEILNWDAHADVRELKQGQAHSGSPFRQAVEDPSGACRRYSVAGLQPHAVARAHLDYVHQHGRVLWRDEVTPDSIDRFYAGLEAPALVSFDLDAVAEAEAPGVSAPNAGGLAGDLWLRAAYGAGRSAAVASADIVELNPAVDRGSQTARLAALTVWWLLRGRAERGT